MERGRKRFLQLQEDRNALLSASNVRNAPPAVYTRRDGSERPILPLLNVPNQWKVPIIIGYLNALWEWQGASLPIPWETEDTPLDAVDRIVQSYRLPNGVLRLLTPEEWSDDMIQSFENHVHSGQRRLLPNQQIFQFFVMAEDLVDSELRLSRNPDGHSWVLGLASRMFIARLLKREVGDDSAVGELLFQFPPLSDDENFKLDWSVDELNELRAHCLGDSRVCRLAKEYVAFEQAQPLQACRSRWDKYRHDSMQMDFDCPVSSFFIEQIGGWWLPPSFFRRAATRDTLRNQSEFVGDEEWYDMLTGTIFGGCYGIRWPVLLLIRSFWNLKMADDSEVEGKPKYFRNDVFAPYDLDNVYEDIDWLADELKSGRERIETIRKRQETHEYPSSDFHDHEFVRVDWAPAPPVVPAEEEPAPISPTRPHSILKTASTQADKPKKKATKGKVMIVLPAPKKNVLIEEKNAPEHAEIEQICQELLAISRRIEQGRPPNIEHVRGRLAFLLDGVIDLLSAGSNTEILAITMGERKEKGISLISATERVKDFVDMPAHDTLFEPLKMWCRQTLSMYTTVGIISRAHAFAVTEAISTRLGGLRIFDPATVENVIGPELLALFDQYSPEIASLKDLGVWVNEYEDHGPPHLRPRFADDPTLQKYSWVPKMNMTDKEAIEWIVSDPVLEFINVSTPKARQLGGPGRIAEWFDSEPFLDPDTGQKRPARDPEHIFNSSSDDDPKGASKLPPPKRKKTGAASEGKKGMKEPEVVIKQEPVAKPSSKRTSRPTPRTTPSNPDSVFKRPAIDVDSLLAAEEPEVESESPHESVKSKGKGKAMKHKARETPAFEPPAENDPIFGRIDRNAGDRAPRAGTARRTASAAGSVAGTRRMTRSVKGPK
ncbi:hypothetical protein FRC11_003428 [Ceratobasidium sp. 423]|nr:hypothetical protein FRC11_003428 [Ceratobasidium sp. 423]